MNSQRPLPLHGLDRLSARPQVPIVVCENKKDADGAQELLPQYVCLAPPEGTAKASKADWTPLHGRRVILWMAPQKEAATNAVAVAELVYAAGATSVSTAVVPRAAARAWAAGSQAESCGPERAAELIAGAKAFPRRAAMRKRSGGARSKQAQRDSLMGLCDRATLWHGPDGEGYASIPVGDHHENWPLSSQRFRRWLGNLAYTELNLIIAGQMLDDLLRILEARAYAEGIEQAPWRRVGSREGKLYIDLTDSRWQAVEIGPNGWGIVPGKGLPFLRSKRALPLPIPHAGYSFDELRPFVNVTTDDEFILVTGWLLGALRDRGDYAVILFTGEHGSGKSTLIERLRSLIDPSAPSSQGPPPSERDLAVTAQNSHVLAFDNLSSLSPWLSDALARITSGVGSAYRKLHTDTEENVSTGARPVMLGSIPTITDVRADISSRTLVIRLRWIRDELRKPKDELEAKWSIARPRIFGVLCDGLSSALRRINETRLSKYGRNADLEKWVNAAEPGLGWQPGTFSRAYEANRRNASDAAFEADPIAVAIASLIQQDFSTGWSGTATRLLDLLGNRIPESLKRSEDWPRTAQGLGNQLERIKPLLRQRGINVERKHSGERTITIIPKGAAPAVHERTEQ